MSLPTAIAKTVLTVFSRIGVPLFLEISGILLLSRDYSSKEAVKRFYKNNWLGLFITAEIWYAIMYLYQQANAGSILRTQGVGRALIGLVKNAFFIDQVTFGSMWYMSMILVVYMMIPLIADVLKNVHRAAILIPAGVVLVLGTLVPNIQECLSILGRPDAFTMELKASNLFSVYVLYLLAGYYIGKGKLERISNGTVVAGGIVGFMAVCGYQLWVFSCGEHYEIAYDFLPLFVLSVFWMEGFRRFLRDSKVRAWGIRLSQISFGVYFLHMCIMSGINALVNRLGLNPLVKTFTLEIVSVLGAVLVIEILSKNRLAKKYLFMIKDGK